MKTRPSLPERLARLLFRRASKQTRSTNEETVAENDVNTINLTVTGPANRSILVAAKNINLYGSALLIPIAVGMIAVILVSSIMWSRTFRATRPAPFDDTGKDYALDFAIVPFDVIAQGNSECSQIAADMTSSIAKSMTEKIRSQISQQNLASSIRLWPPVAIKGIPARTSEETYRLAVEKYAAEHKVDLMLYATVECDDDGVTVQPFFHVTPGYFKDEPELLGIYEFDSFITPIRDRIGPTTMGEVDKEISSRASTLALLSLGLEHYAQHTNKHYLRAAELFAQVVSATASHSNQVTAIAETFLGNSYQNASIGDCGELNNEMLQKAYDHYFYALKDEPQYAPAYLGMGNVMNLRALFSTESVLATIRSFIAEGEKYYQQALRAAIRPSDANIEWKVLHARAQAKLIEREFTTDAPTRAALLDQADMIAAQMLNKYNAIDAAGAPQRSMAARTYLMRGDILYQLGSTPDAMSAYEMAVAAATNDPRLVTEIAHKLALMKTENDDVCGAAANYRIAVDNSACDVDRAEYQIEARDFELWCKLQTQGSSILSAKVPFTFTQPLTITPPNLTGVKTSQASLRLIAGSSTITYTLSVTNTGRVTAYNVVVTDNLPSQVKPLNNSADMPNTNPFVWQIGTLEPGDYAVATLVVAVLPHGGGNAIINHFTGIADDAERFSSNTVSDPIAKPKIVTAISATADTLLLPGTGMITYMLYVTNTGAVPANDVMVTDTLPYGLELKNTPDDGDHGNTFLWPIGILSESQSVSATIIALVTNAAPEIVANMFSGSAAGIDTFYSNMITRAIGAPDMTLAVTSNGDRPLIAGSGKVTYTFLLINSGNVPLPHVILTQTLPAGMRLADPACEAPVMQSWNIGDIPIGTAITITANAQVCPGTEGQAFQSIVTATAGIIADPVLARDTDPLLVAAPTLTAAISDPQSDLLHNPGILSYTLWVTNTGDGPALDVSISQVAPPSELADAPSSLGAHDSATWHLDAIPAQTAVSVTLAVATGEYGEDRMLQASFTITAANVGMAITVTASVAAITGMLPERVLEAAPNLIITTTAVSRQAQVLDTLEWQIMLSNVGSVTTTGVYVSELVPKGFVMKSATPGHVKRNNGARWLVEVSPFASTVPTVSGVIPANHGELLNVATYEYMDQNGSATSMPVMIKK
jgi:uncharacterized repeat protein (TIGR01451 family)